MYSAHVMRTGQLDICKLSTCSHNEYRCAMPPQVQ